MFRSQNNEKAQNTADENRIFTYEHTSDTTIPINKQNTSKRKILVSEWLRVYEFQQVLRRFKSGSYSTKGVKEMKKA